MGDAMVQQVYLIGSSQLQNEALAYFMTKELGVRCSMVAGLGCIPPGVEGAKKRVVLCEYYGANGELHRLNESDSNGILDTDNVILMLEHFDGMVLVSQALQYGVRGFILKTGGIAKIRKMMEALSRGELWIPRELVSPIVESRLNRKKNMVEIPELSPREMDILRSLATGKTNTTIAEMYCLSPHTVKTHAHRIYQKLNVSTRLEAARWAAENL